MGTLKKLRKKVKKTVGGVTRQVGRSGTQIGQSAGHKLAYVSPYVLATIGAIYGGPEGAGLGAGIGTSLDRKYNHHDSWKESLGTGTKAGLGTYAATSGINALANWAVPEAMSALGYDTGVSGASSAAGSAGAAGGNAVLDPTTGQATSYVPKTVGTTVPGTAPSTPGLLGDLGGYGKYITPTNLMVGGMGYGLLKGGGGVQDGGSPAPGTFSPQLPPYMGTGMPQQGMAPQGMPGMAPGYMESQGMMNQLMARMQNPQMMQNPMQNPLFTR